MGEIVIKASNRSMKLWVLRMAKESGTPHDTWMAEQIVKVLPND